jgi:hypothetical protein
MAKQPAYRRYKTPDRRNRTEHLGKSVGRLTKPLFGRRGMADGSIIHDWPAIAGTAIAMHSQPEKVTYPSRERTGGLLHLRVDNSAMATQLQHLEPQLLERINSHFGYRAVARLRFIHGPLPKPAIITRTAKTHTPSPERKRELAQTLDSVDDPDLRRALEKLGEALPGSESDTESGSGPDPEPEPEPNSKSNT